MKQRFAIYTLCIFALILCESGCNEVLGLDNACLSCGGAVVSCTTAQCPLDEDLCDSQVDAWRSLKSCICQSCFTCGELCGDTDLNEGCAKCIKEQVDGPNAPCKTENAVCRF